eukprot:8543688-Lingulodinium_polyedra.AAC.1
MAQDSSTYVVIALRQGCSPGQSIDGHVCRGGVAVLGVLAPIVLLFDWALRCGGAIGSTNRAAASVHGRRAFFSVTGATSVVVQSLA